MALEIVGAHVEVVDIVRGDAVAVEVDPEVARASGSPLSNVSVRMTAFQSPP